MPKLDHEMLRDYFGGNFMPYGDPIFFGSGPGFVNRTQSDPGFVNPVRSSPRFVNPIRSRSGLGFVNALFLFRMEVS